MAVQRMPREAFCLMAAASFIAGAQTIVWEMILLRLATRYTGSAADGTTMALSLYLLGLLAGAAIVLRLNQATNKIGKSVWPRYIPLLFLLLAALSGPLLGYLSQLKSLPLPGIVLPLIVFWPALLAGTVFPLILMLCSRFYFGSLKDSHGTVFDESGSVVNTNRTNMLLYLLSNLGSASGAMGSAIWLLPYLGMANTFASSGLVWLLIMLLLSPFILTPFFSPTKHWAQKATDYGDRKEEEDFIDPEEAVVSVNRPFTYACVFASALAALIFECLTIRLLSLICGASFVTTACAITATLIAIAAGARLSLLLPTSKNIRITIALALSLAAIGLALSLLLLPHLNNVFQALRQLAGQSSVQADAHAKFLGYLYPRLLLSLTLCLPGATGLALLFPLAAKSASRPADILRLYIAGGIGTALAPALYYLAMGRLSLPHIASTMELLLRLLIIALVALTVAALGRQAWQKKNSSSSDFLLPKLFTLLNTASAAAILFLLPPLDVNKVDIGLSFVPSNLPLKTIITDALATPRLFYKEGRTATISVLSNLIDNTVVLRSDGKVEGTIPEQFSQAAPNSDLATQSLLALLPAAWRTTPAHSYFLIGFGTGTTMATLASIAHSAENTGKKADLEIKAVEIEPAVLDAAPYFQRNAKILEASQRFANATAGDARKILEDSPQTYDAIISQPAEPWVQGSTNLYSAEFYALIKRRLNTGGSFCQWLQLYGLDQKSLLSALKTFQMIFPNCLVFHQPGAGEVLLLGFAGPAPARDCAEIKENFKRQDLRSLLALAGVDSFAAWQNDIILESAQVAKLLQDQVFAAEAQSVTDDNLALELALVPEIESGSEHIRANLQILQKYSQQAYSEKSIEEKSWQEDPASVQAINFRALQLLRAADTQKPDTAAQSLIEESLKLDPSRAGTHMLRALLLLKEGKVPETLKEADLAHRLNLGDCRPFMIASAAFYLAGDKTEALAKINRARQISPHGVLLKEVGRMEDHFAGPLPTLESKTYAGTLASRLTRLLEDF